MIQAKQTVECVCCGNSYVADDNVPLTQAQEIEKTSEAIRNLITEADAMLRTIRCGNAMRFIDRKSRERFEDAIKQAKENVGR